MVRSGLSKFSLSIYLINLIKGEKFFEIMQLSSSSSTHSTQHGCLRTTPCIVISSHCYIENCHTSEVPCKKNIRNLIEISYIALTRKTQKHPCRMDFGFMMCSLNFFNPLTPIRDQDRISPYDINTISTRQVMRIRKNISQRIIS